MAQQSWIDSISTLAPKAALALTSPLLYSFVRAEICKALELPTDTSEETLQTNINNCSSEHLQNLKNVESIVNDKLTELNINMDLLVSQNTDKDNAKLAYIKSLKDDKITPAILAIITAIIFIVCVIFVFSTQFKNLDINQIGLVGTVIGYASAKFDTVIGYYFGTGVFNKRVDFNAFRK